MKNEDNIIKKEAGIFVKKILKPQNMQIQLNSSENQMEHASQK